MAKTLIFDSIAHAETSVPLNKIVKLRIESHIICLTRTERGFFAFEKDCPHMTDDLGKGKTNHLNEVVCPWHNYRFNLKTGEEAERRCGDLKTIAVLINEGQLFLDD